MIYVWRLIQTSNFSRIQLIFTMYGDVQCLPVKINIAIYALDLETEKFDVWNEVFL